MIRFVHVTKSYSGRLVIEDFSLDIAAGEFVALVGASGAGKTTVLKAINRLVEIDEGTIEVEGADIAAWPLTDLRRRIGYVFQGIGLMPHMSVAQNIWLPRRLAGAPAEQRDARIAELLALVSLPADIASRYPAQLSGGQAQRVGFARALASGASIMLMDEPFGALDPLTRSELGTAYCKLHDSLRLTSLLVTHDMAEALLLADRVVVLGEGGILADLPPADLMRFDGDPRVQAMLATVRNQAARLEALAKGQP